MYCGGPIGFLCDDCKRVLDRYFELKKKYDDWWENTRHCHSSNEKVKDDKK